MSSPFSYPGPQASPAERAARLDRVRAALQERFPGGGPADVPMRTWCWRADRVSRGAEPG